jgi:hypothetical protein
MPHRTSVADRPPSFVPHGRTGGDACHPSDGASHSRHECVRDMDRRIADAVRRGGLTRGAALALHGEVVETHPEDPCSARELLELSLGELVTAS